VLVAVRYAAPGQPSPIIEFVGNPIIAEFILGCIIAQIRMQNRTVGILSIIVAVTVFTLLGPTPNVHDGRYAFNGTVSAPRLLSFGLPAAGLVFGTLQFERAFHTRWGRALTYLGDASYALYLTHTLLLEGIYLLAHAMHWAGWPLIGAALISAVLAGAAVHELVEKPINRRISWILSNFWKTTRKEHATYLAELPRTTAQD
jgi:peptidoglycan/LPS O-acetylase OafA/YrhL